MTLPTTTLTATDMQTAPVTQQVRQLRRRYVVVLFCIALLVIASQVAIQIVIADKTPLMPSLETVQWISWGFLVVALSVLALGTLLLFKPVTETVAPAPVLTPDKQADNEEQLKQLFEDSPLAMVMVDAETLHILLTNQRTVELTQLDEPALIQQPLTALLQDTYTSNRLFLEKLNTHAPLNEFDVVLLTTQSGEMECMVTPRIISYGGRKAYLLGLTNVSDLGNARDSLEYYATYDELTGLVNRRTGMMLLEKAMARSWRDQHPLSIIYANLDGLKLANERYGKSEGDELLRAAATIMTGLIRSSDFAVRLGNDDFMMILPSCPPQNAQAIVENMERLLKSAKVDSTRQFIYSVSTGTATFAEDKHSSPEDLLMDARKNIGSGEPPEHLH